MSSVAAARAPRAMCARCRRPTSVCYCAALPRLDTQTRVMILQHPRERDMPIGTARMASLCLPRAELHVGIRWDEHAGVAAALADPARPAILLYPGEGAKDVLREPPSGPVTLVVVDGTWSQAKAVVRDNPVLRALPRYAFAAPEPSQYRIRREPKLEYVSTIEALMHVLGVLEHDAARFRALRDPLNAMVEAQLACQRDSPRRMSYRLPRAPVRDRERLPGALTRELERLVLVIGEANAWPYDAPERQADELVHWVAHRPATGASFEAVVAPRGAIAPSTTFHVRLDEAALRAGGSRAELAARFGAFTREGDVLATWGHHGPTLWREAFGAPLGKAVLDLRAAAHRLLRRKAGALEAYAASLGDPIAPLGAGRAGHRLAMLAQIVAAWRALP